MTVHPSTEVPAAFGLEGHVEPLAGGYETSVLVDGVVLKQAMNLAVAAFGQEVLSRVSCPSIVIPEPLHTVSGEWAAVGWTATRFVEGLIPARYNPVLLLEVGWELAEALALLPDVDVAPVRSRTDRWAVAERFAFDEVTLPLSAETKRVADVLRAHVGDDAAPNQLIHADLAGNVFTDPLGRPVVLDFTPAIRPVGFQAGVVIADSLLWGDQNPAHAVLLGGDMSNLARALLFRLIAAELAGGAGNADRLSCERSIDDLGWS